MTGAEELNIGGPERGAAFGERDDVVEVEFSGGAATGAFTPVALPHFELDSGGDDAAAIFGPDRVDRIEE